MATHVEQLARQPNRIAELVVLLASFLERPGNDNAVRLAVLGVTPIVAGNRNWAACKRKFRKLFPADKYPFEFNDETIRRYVHGLSQPRDETLRAYLFLFALSELERTPSLYETDKVIRNSSRIGAMVSLVDQFLGTGDVKTLLGNAQGVDTAEAVAHVARALRASSDDRQLYPFLFGVEVDEGLVDSSYYLCYRYSTQKREIVKTFLAIQTPRASTAGCFSFVHVYLEGVGAYRISRGAILNFESCVHFVGGSAGARRYGPTRNQGIKTIAIPVGSPNVHSYHMLAGVFLSHALGWQPIVGRCALIHLGFISQLGHELRHTDIDIGMYRAEGFVENDLQSLDEKLGFSSRTKRSVEEMNNFVLKEINNYPEVDRGNPENDGLQRALGVEDGREPAV